MQIIKIALIILFIILFFFENKLLIYQKYIKYILNVIDVSIIIPVYNSEKYLPLCLNSIISQTLLNIEIICINDGSTDKSLEILREYKIKDNRIIIIQQKNQGSGIARNNGIKISKGKFITFMDSDDLYPDNYTLESMFKNVILNKVLICGGGLNTFVHQNNKIKIIKNVKNSFHKNRILYFSSYQYDFYYQRFIYNKNFIKKNKLYFPDYMRYQDPPFFIKAMGLAKKFYALKNATYCYRSFRRKLKFNERKITDIYKGIRDCLQISKSMNLYKLYYLILSRLNSKMIINQAKKFTKSKNLKEIISKIINHIDYDLLKKNNFTFIIDLFYRHLK
jgi:glycosyltransferase involved in cell wall biosynthesis